MRSVVLAVLLLAVSSSTLALQCKIAKNFPLFNQCDPKWGSNPLGSSSTICKVGCLMSSVAAGLAGFGKTINGQTPNPQNLNTFLKANGGFSGNMFVWGAVERFGVRFEGWNRDRTAMKNAICANKIVILNVNNGGHWVLATGANDSGFTVNDTGYDRSTYSNDAVVDSGIYRVV